MDREIKVSISKNGNQNKIKATNKTNHSLMTYFNQTNNKPLILIIKKKRRSPKETQLLYNNLN